MRRAVVAVLAAWSLACAAGESGEADGGGEPRAEKPRKARPDRAAPRRGAEPEEDVRVNGVFAPQADPCARWEKPGVWHYDFPWQGRPTRGVIFVPESAGRRDLVVALHAGDATPGRILQQTRFVEKATQEGFVVLAPSGEDADGRGPRWNSGKFDGMQGQKVRDDVAYLDALVRKVSAEVCADRVLAAGFSSGGQMVHRWACEGTEADAVLSAAGELLVDPAGCRGPRAVRGYVGTLDKVFDGPALEGSDQPSAPETIELWARINRCDPAAPPIESLEGDARCKRWQGCRASTELCVVQDFPHGWPAPWNTRKPTRCSATDEGWAWFRGPAAAP